MRNQPEKKQQKRCQCGSIKHLQVFYRVCSVGFAIKNAKTLALGMAYLNKKQIRKQKIKQEENKYLVEEATGEGEII